MVVKAICGGDRRFQRYDLHSFVVMPNHVHLLVTSRISLAKWLRRALELLHQTGAFRQNESYDHLVRNDEEFRRIQRYIEWNPVKAGFAPSPEDFQWSSAEPKLCLGAEAPPRSA